MIHAAAAAATRAQRLGYTVVSLRFVSLRKLE